MIEEQSLESFSDKTENSAKIENNASTSFDLNKCNLYVEKIRELFVPSLEGRIHSCLENFVYRKDEGELSEFSYLKRCLNVAAAWREPVDAFCTKWTDENIIENMLGQAVKYLIKDGLVDCFLNSIILNNRLSKICRDLDALGYERDFLRYLTVWNYINERDYWLENDERITMSMSRQSYDTIDRHSDLDVEIGSRVRNHEKFSGKALKRRATDDSSEKLSNNNDDFSQNFDANDRLKPQYESWLSVDTSIKEESGSNDGPRRKRSFCQKISCRASTCPIYRMKKFQQTDWEGKILKLKISKFSSTTLKGESLKSMKISKLCLPCKFDDLIGKIVNADATLPESSSTRRRKKFQASIINICCRINEILEKIGKNEIRRCRLDCEIFHDLLGLRLMKREQNGCKVCLLSERVAMNKIEGKSRNTSRGSSIGQLTQIAENGNSQESNLTTYESARFDLDDPQINQSSEIKAEITRDLSGNVFDTSEGNFEHPNLNNSEESTRKSMIGNGAENEACHCEISSVTELVRVDQENQNNQKPDHPKYFHPNSRNLEQSSRKESKIDSTGNILKDQACHCSTSFYDKPDHGSENNEGIENIQKLSQKELLGPSNGKTHEDQACYCNISLDDAPDHSMNNEKTDQEKSRCRIVNQSRKDQEKLARKRTLINLIANLLDDQESRCNVSIGDAPDQCENRKENSPIKLTRKKSSIHSDRNVSEDQECLCNFSFDNLPDHIDHVSKIKEDCMECRDKRLEDIPDSNRQHSKDTIFLSNSYEVSKRKNEETSDSSLRYTPANCREVPELQKDLITFKSVMNAPNGNEQENQYDEIIACECPSDCTCINKEISNDQATSGDSQCSRDSYHDLDPKNSLNRQINDPLISDVSDKISIKKDQDLIVPRDKREFNCIEAEEINKENNKSNKSQNKSKISRQFDPRKVKSRSLNETAIKDSTSVVSDQEFLVATSVQCECSEIKESKVKSCPEGSPIVSARLKKSKGQRINISIELCSESESSKEKIPKTESKNISTLQNDSKKNQSFGHIATKVAPSRQSRCIFIDQGNSDKQLNSLQQKNTKDERLDGTNDRIYSPSRPMEFRDYLPSMERPSSMRNSNVYGIPMKSVERSNHKFDGRSKSQDKRNIKNYETRECYESIRNGRSFDKKMQKQIQSDGEEIDVEFPRVLGKSERFSNSIVNDHLCHGFSSNSVNRMRHLIKTKLRKILLERDKSTNTSKMTLTNRKYRVSVPNGKTERKQFCRTIWESHSPSDSTPTSRSFVSDDRTFSAEICDREKITDIFDSSVSARPKMSSKNRRNFPMIFRDSDFSKNRVRTKSDGRNRSNGAKNHARLAGGSDFVSRKKEIKDEEFQCLKKQRHEFSGKFAKKENQYSSNPQTGRSCEKSINCGFHKITENVGDSSANVSDLLNGDDCDSRVSRKKYENELIAGTGKLDSAFNSTSRHIYLYEFGQFETSNDELFHCWEQKEPFKKINSQKIRKEKLAMKNLKINEKVYPKNVYDSRTKNSRFNQKENKIPRSIDELKNSSSNPDTMNYREKSFNYLDHDLRSKLSQYVSLCKNVKYSLLKRLRPVDIYGAKGTSIPCRNRYKFGDS